VAVQQDLYSKPFAILVLILDRAGKGVEYCFISHTGFGGVAYAMAITCLRLQAEIQLASLPGPSYKSSEILEPILLAGNQQVVSTPVVGSLAFQQGDYRDILSLVRVLVNGPASKAEVDIIIDRYAISNLKNFASQVYCQYRHLQHMLMAPSSKCF
jgi:hypothetical protein